MIILSEKYTSIDATWAQRDIIKNEKKIDACPDFISVLKMLNGIFLGRGVSFTDEERYGHDWLYGEVGIQLSGIYEDGSIFIVLDRDNLLDHLKDHYQFLEFARYVRVILSHELLHRQQLHHIPYEFQTEREYDTGKNSDYLRNPREIDAHAQEAIQDFVSMGYTKKDILSWLPSYAAMKDHAVESKAAWKYWDYYGLYSDDREDGVWRRFLTRMYDFAKRLPDKAEKRPL